MRHFGRFGLADALPPGTRTDVSPALAAILQTQKGREIFDTAKQGVRAGWNVRAVGGQTPEQVTDRIAGVFTEFYAGRWTAPVTLTLIATSPELERVVNSVCSLCAKKAQWEFYPPTPGPSPSPGPVTDGGKSWFEENQKTLLIGAAVVVGLLVVGALFTRRRGAAPVTAMVSVPATLVPAK